MNYKIIKKSLVCKQLPTNMCHGSTVLPFDDQVLMAWFGGEYEGLDDTKIYFTRLVEGDWEEPIVLSTDNLPHWNPVLSFLGKGKIALYYKVGREIATWQTMVRYSNDNGLTWSNPIELVSGDKGGRGPVRCKTIMLNSGRVLAPGSTECDGKWEAFVDFTDDNGLNWQKSNVIGIEEDKEKVKNVNDSNIQVSEQSFYGRGVIQPTLWASDESNVHMLLRSTEGYIYRSDSEDYGETWCSAYPTSLPNNNSGIDIERREDGLLLLASNPVSANWGHRTPLNLSISTDNGVIWETLFDLDSGDGEFSYPAVVYYKGIHHISYTWNRINVAYWQISLGRR